MKKKKYKAPTVKELGKVPPKDLKQPYKKPVLKEFGKVGYLTQSGTANQFPEGYMRCGPKRGPEIVGMC